MKAIDLLDVSRNLNSPEVVAEIERKGRLFDKYGEEIVNFLVPSEPRPNYLTKYVKTKLILFLTEYNQNT